MLSSSVFFVQMAVYSFIQHFKYYEYNIYTYSSLDINAPKWYNNMKRKHYITEVYYADETDIPDT